ncbi:MAG: hypothetical protein ACREVG_08960 [Burkholderiales bacterium]
MTSEEVKDFWRGWCDRRGLGADVVVAGEALIDEDPEFWADQTMDQLLRMISEK